MSIYPTSCTSIMAMPDAVLLLWLCGILLGVGLTLLSRRVCDLVRRRMRYKRHMKTEAAQLQRKRQEEMAFLQRKQQKEALDHLTDERMVCSECWQERHPGMLFSFPGLRLCREHSRRSQRASAVNAGAICQQAPINPASSINQHRVIEGVCA